MNVIKQRIQSLAISELESNWRDPQNGSILKEREISQLPILNKYWESIQVDEPVRKSYRKFNPKNRAVASSKNKSAWSAAFICYVYRCAGITLEHGFEFSRRHITYITKAVMNGAGQPGNGKCQLQFFDKSEFGPNSGSQLFDSISAGDLICLNRRRKSRRDSQGNIVTGTRSNHTLKSLSRATNLEKVRDVSHCDIVVDKYQSSGKHYIDTIGGNVSHTVARKTFEVSDEKIFLVVNGKRRASHYFGFARF